MRKAIVVVFSMTLAVGKAKAVDYFYWVANPGENTCQTDSFFDAHNWDRALVPCEGESPFVCEAYAVFDVAGGPSSWSEERIVYFGDCFSSDATCSAILGGDAVSSRLFVNAGTWVFDLAGKPGSVCDLNPSQMHSYTLNGSGYPDLLVGNQDSLSGIPGQAKLTVRNGRLITPNAYIGEFPAECSGELVISGISAELVSTGAVVVGWFTQGMLIAEAGATINGSLMIVGFDHDGIGVLEAKDPRSAVNVFSDLQIGYHGQSEVLINNGASIIAENFISAIYPDASANITVENPGSTFWVYGEFDLGDEGRTVLNIRDGARFVVRDDDHGDLFGGGDSGYVEVNLDGLGSTFSISDDLIIGGLGETRLHVRDGAKLGLSGRCTVGNGSGSEVFILLDGQASEFHSDNLILGFQGNADLVGQNGAKSLLSTPTGGVTLGNLAGSFGTLTVSGAGSYVDGGNLLRVGLAGAGAVTVIDGAEFRCNNAELSSFSGATSELTVSGLGAYFYAIGQVTVGGTRSTPGGSATLRVETPAVVEVGQLLVHPGSKLQFLLSGVHDPGLKVHGAITFNGELELNFDTGFMPEAGMELVVITFGSLANLPEVLVQGLAGHMIALPRVNQSSVTLHILKFPDGNSDSVLTTEDFSVLPKCLSGPGSTVQPNCSTADLDGDGDVDLKDIGYFQELLGL